MNTDNHAQKLHDSAVVIDGHSDILIPLAKGKMRLGDRVEAPDMATWRPPPDLEQSPPVQLGFSPHALYFEPMGQYDIP
jgi:hypothetical protein